MIDYFDPIQHNKITPFKKAYEVPNYEVDMVHVIGLLESVGEP